MTPNDIAAISVFIVAFVVFVCGLAAMYLLFELQVARSHNSVLQARLHWMQREIEQQQETIRLLRGETLHEVRNGADRSFIQ